MCIHARYHALSKIMWPILRCTHVGPMPLKIMGIVS